MKSAYLLIAHGSRDPQSQTAFDELLERFKKLRPDRHVEGAYLEICRPDIPQGIQNCIEQGIREIFVIPLMVFPGKHVKEHIPKIIQEARQNHPDVDFHYAGPLSEDPKLLEILEGKCQK